MTAQQLSNPVEYYCQYQKLRHIHYGFTAVKITGLSAGGLMFGPPGFAISLLNIVGVIMRATFGAGALSIDRWFGGRAAAVRR